MKACILQAFKGGNVEGLFEIENDLFDICSRIKEIDENYKIMRNKIASRFEIHSKKGLEIVLPFDKLDCRTLERVAETRLENIEKLLLRFECENAVAERNIKNQMVEKSIEKIMEKKYDS